MGGTFLLSEIHPDRSKEGVLAHFKTSDGEDLHLSSSPHSENEIRWAAVKSGFEVLRVENVLGNQELTGQNPKWEKHLGNPLIQIWQMQRVQKINGE